MKTKGIPVWELYLEYIVLGIAALVFVGFGVWQFVLEKDSNNTDVAKHGSVGPRNLEEVLSSEAERIGSFVELTAPPPMEIRKPEPAFEQFKTELSASISANATLDLPQMAMTLEASDNEPVGVPLVLPSAPAPHTVLAVQQHDGLAEAVLEQHETLKERFPEAPYDVTWVTAGAKINVGEVLKRYATPGDSGEAAIPEGWYDGRPTVVDVRVERQELVDGRWGNLTTVDLLPGADSLRTEIQTEVTASVGRDFVDQLKVASLQRAIIQPDFLDTIGDNWLPPVERSQVTVSRQASEEQREVLRLRRDIETGKKSLIRLRNQVTKEEEALRNQGGGGAAGGAVGGAMGGAGGAQMQNRDGSRRAAEDRSKRLQANVDKAKRILKNKEDEINRKIARLTELGEEIAAIDEQAAEEDLFALEEWELYAHDMNVEIGKVYRYRFTVQLYNPLFNKTFSLIDSQRPQARQFSYDSQTSDWSEPIEVRPPLRYFVASARADNPGTPSQAKVEVFRFWGGRWWQEEFNVAPGERIGGLEQPRYRGRVLSDQDIDFRTDMYVLDIVADMDWTDEDREDGLAATVWLDRIAGAMASAGSQAVEQRHPKWRSDAEDIDRDLLQSAVDDANTQALFDRETQNTGVGGS